MSRASTMLLALLIMNTLLGVLCLVVAGRARDTAGLRRWGYGLLLYSVGILITIPDFLPYDLRKVVGNALIAYAPILSVAGTIAHTGWRLDTRWTTAGFLASIAPIVWNHTRAEPFALIDFLAPAPLANVLFVYGIVALLRAPPPATRGAARFLAAILAFSVAVWTARMVGIWLSMGGVNDRERSDLVVAMFAIAQMVIVVAATLGLLWVEVRRMEAELRLQADSDALTGLLNRRATMERFRTAAARAQAGGDALGLAVFDVDHFKQVNDSYGHQKGDAALRHVAAVLASRGARGDGVGRIGGEEFVVLLPRTSSNDAVAAADALRDAIAQARPADPDTPTVTVSGGVALFPQDGADWDHLFAAADRRLYAAKSAGRNRVLGPG